MDFTQGRRIEGRQSTNRFVGPVVGQPSHTRHKRRQSGVFTAIHRLDAQLAAADRAELARWIRDHYETEYGDVPLGLVAVCHLGPPYVDHRMDLFQSILEHYAPADPMPAPFANARMLVRSGGYAFVEVYASGALVPVRDDGDAIA